MKVPAICTLVVLAAILLVGSMVEVAASIHRVQQRLDTDEPAPSSGFQHRTAAKG